MDKLNLEQLNKLAQKTHTGFTLRIESPLVGPVDVEILEDNVALSEKHVTALNYFTEMTPPRNISVLKGMLYTHYWQARALAERAGRKPPEYKINSPEDALAMAKMVKLQLDHLSRYKREYCFLYLEAPWETKPLVVLICANTITDWGKYRENYYKYEKFDKD